jgi:uncharacterized protein HemX
LIFGSKKVAMDNGSPEQSAPDHQDRKGSLRGLLLMLLMVVLSIGLSVVWFTLIGYGVVALFHWVAG